MKGKACGGKEACGVHVSTKRGVVWKWRGGVGVLQVRAPKKVILQYGTLPQPRWPIYYNSSALRW